MVKVYAVCCAALADRERLNAVLPLLDPTRRARVARLQDAKKQAQCTAAGLLLTHLFSNDGQPPRFTHGSRGKPYLVGENAPFFSLSHSGDWVFCGVADSEIGLDAQEFTPCREKIFTRWFTDAERTWLSEKADERFAMLWAKKEAYCKFTGFGLVLPPSSFSVPCPANGWDEANRCCWHEYTHSAETPIAVAVCCKKVETFADITALSLHDLL
jgi:4'-phosphopantetheinyl transferase